MILVASKPLLDCTAMPKLSGCTLHTTPDQAEVIEHLGLLPLCLAVDAYDIGMPCGSRTCLVQGRDFHT